MSLISACEGASIHSPGTAVFDLDGTMTRGDTYLPYLIGFLMKNPWRLPRTLWLPSALALYYTGVRNNTWLKTAFLKSVLADLCRADIDNWTGVYVKRLLRDAMRPRALERLDQHRGRGDRLVLATASLDIYVEQLADHLGFDDVVCTRIAWSPEGRLTGDLDGGNCYGETKLSRVRDLLSKAASGSPMTFYSDHHSDLPLLRFATRAVVINPSRRLRDAADGLGFEIQDWDE